MYLKTVIAYISLSGLTCLEWFLTMHKKPSQAKSNCVQNYCNGNFQISCCVYKYHVTYTDTTGRRSEKHSELNRLFSLKYLRRLTSQTE